MMEGDCFKEADGLGEVQFSPISLIITLLFCFVSEN